MNELITNLQFLFAGILIGVILVPVVYWLEDRPPKDPEKPA